MKNKIVDQLLEFIDLSPTAFHATENLKNLFLKEKFTELKKEESWSLEKGKKYFVTNSESSIIAFTVGKNDDLTFRIIGSHCDYPGFRLKPKTIMKVRDQYIKLNTEVYGGPILSTWFDRPLSLAGRVLVKSDNPMKPVSKLINVDKDLLTIANLAIHMNRDVNSGYKYNAQVDTLPLIAMVNEELEKDNLILKIISQEAGVKEEEILDFDLFLYAREKSNYLGYNSEFFQAGGIDNLSMAHASSLALIEGKGENINLIFVSDNEEVGSNSRAGADSPFLAETIKRICLSLSDDKECYYKALSKSFMVSADCAHALHPNYPDQADPTNYPIVNKGPVVKTAANKAYTSDGYSASIFKSLCEKADVPYQDFTNRSDKRGGSTIGPITTSHLDIAAVDVGSPILAMHSVKELGGVKDQEYAYKVFKELFNN